MPPDPSPLPPWKAEFLRHCVEGGVLRFGSFTLKSGRQSPYFFNAGLFHRADLLRSISTAFAYTIASWGSLTEPLTQNLAPTDPDPAGHLTSPPAPRQPLEFEVLFGPAYKGIPLAATTTEKLAGVDGARFGRVSYAFDRKEAKDHGERGRIVGCPLAGRRVLVVDDVITAGTAVRHAIEVIRAEGGVLVGVVVALDRMERVSVEEGEGDDDRARDDVGEKRGEKDDNGEKKGEKKEMKEKEEKDGERRRHQSAIEQVAAEYGVPVLSILTLDEIIEGLTGIGSEGDVAALKEYRRRYGAGGVEVWS